LLVLELDVAFFWEINIFAKKNSMNIKLESGYNRELTLKKTYSEQIVYHHYQGIYANFDCTLTPISYSDNIQLEVYLIDQGVECVTDLYENVFQEVLEVIINQKADEGVGFNGFNIKIVHNHFHSVDTKPYAFRSTFFDFFQRLFEQDVFQSSVIKYETNCPIFNLEIKENENKSMVMENYFLTHNYLPKVKNKTLALVDNKWHIDFLIQNRYLRPEDSTKRFLNIYIESDHRMNSYNHVRFRFPKDVNIEFTYFVKKQVNRFIDYVYNQLGYNLGGFLIIFDEAAINSIEHIETYTFSDALLWSLKNLISNSENINILEKPKFISTY
jgi:hypothetical protein